MINSKVFVIQLIALTVGCSAQDEVLRSGIELEFGTWHSLEMCPNGTFAHGFQVAAKDFVNKLIKDEIGMTGMQLYCSHDANNSDTKISSFVLEGVGSWRGISTCPPGEWIVGFRLRVEQYLGWSTDDTAANDANMLCSSGIPLGGKGNIKGDWQNWANCSEGSVVCGLQTKVEDSRINLDKVGLVSVQLECCPFNQTAVKESRSIELPIHAPSEVPAIIKEGSKNTENSKPSIESPHPDEHMADNQIINHMEHSASHTNDPKHVDDAKSENATMTTNEKPVSHHNSTSNPISQDHDVQNSTDSKHPNENPIEVPV